MSESLLSHIKSPENIKSYSSDDRAKLASEIREALINNLAKTGGHLGPNLGVVELTIALHTVFNTPKDKFTFDVSHQGYVHKMLTGRANEINTIRQYKGLNGFLLRTESEHDEYGAGHAGTAVSSALGMAAARDLKGDDNHVVAVAGDAAFTCGSTLEALNNIAMTTKKFIIVLNDNEWSIDKNVGAIAKYFNALQTHSAYSSIRDTAADFVQKVLGEGARKLAHRIEHSAKNILLPKVLFEDLGIQYYGPIDGHDTELLIKTFEYLKTKDEPVILHIISEKGRGYKPALDKPGKFHGLGPYKVQDGATAASQLPTYSEVFGRALTKFAESDEKLLAITAAMPGGTKLDIFQEAFPKRYFDVGIAEEHAALFACGLATQGFTPFLAIYSTFMQRAYDMIIHDMALQNLPVKLCMDRAGLSGDDGPTHHGLFDIGYLRHVPDLTHMQPKDEDEFVDMLYTMKEYTKGVSAIRYPRGTGTGIEIKDSPELLEIGKAEVIQEGSDVLLIGLGNFFEMAEEAKDSLEEKGYSVSLVNPRFIKPLDVNSISALAKNCKVVCTFEDHVLKHGFGAAVIEALHDENITVKVERIGWPDEFIEHGKVPILRELHGISVQKAMDKIVPHLS